MNFGIMGTFLRLVALGLLLVSVIGCGLRPAQLYPGERRLSSEVATFGSTGIYWGTDDHGGGPIIESIDEIVLCLSGLNCRWRVETLSGEHIIRIRWSEFPQTVVVDSVGVRKTVTAYYSDYSIFKCDLSLNAHAGRGYRFVLEETGRTPVLLSGYETTIIHWQVKVLESTALGLTPAGDQGPVRELCIIEPNRIAAGKCPPCIAQ